MTGPPDPAPAARLPAYVTNGNDIYGFGPAQLTDVTMHNFCVPADGAKLQAWLDRNYADPSGGAVRYRALFDRVFLAVAQIDQVRSIEPNGPPRGYTGEIDVTIWILAHREGADPLSAPRWIPAYLFVDSGAVMAAGREIWGFPKQISRFDFPEKGEQPADAQSFDVTGWVVDPWGPNSPTRWAPLIEARPVPVAAAPARREGVLQTLEALAVRTAERVAGELTVLASRVQAAIGGGSMTMAFLKQYPDAADPQRACYQAIHEAEAVITRHIGSGLSHDDYQLRFHSYASHPFLDELGISGDWQDVGQALWLQFDFTQNLGKILWQAPTA